MTQEQLQKANNLSKEIEKSENIRKILTDKNLRYEFIAKTDEYIERLKTELENL